MRTIVILGVVLFAVIGCGNDEIRNSPPAVDHLIIPEEVGPGDSVELQVVAHDGDGDALIYVWEVEKGKLDSRTGQVVNWTVPLQRKRWVGLVSEARSSVWRKNLGLQRRLKRAERYIGIGKRALSLVTMLMPRLGTFRSSSLSVRLLPG